MAGPRQLNAVFDSRNFGISVFHDSQFEPRPGPGGRVIAKPLVTGFRKELQAPQSLDGGKIEGLDERHTTVLDMC